MKQAAITNLTDGAIMKSQQNRIGWSTSDLDIMQTMQTRTRHDDFITRERRLCLRVVFNQVQSLAQSFACDDPTRIISIIRKIVLFFFRVVESAVGRIVPTKLSS